MRHTLPAAASDRPQWLAASITALLFAPSYIHGAGRGVGIRDRAMRRLSMHDTLVQAEGEAGPTYHAHEQLVVVDVLRLEGS
jgi:hypothetical protein